MSCIEGKEVVKTFTVEHKIPCYLLFYYKISFPLAYLWFLETSFQLIYIFVGDGGQTNDNGEMASLLNQLFSQMLKDDFLTGRSPQSSPSRQLPHLQVCIKHAFGSVKL